MQKDGGADLRNNSAQRDPRPDCVNRPNQLCFTNHQRKKSKELPLQERPRPPEAPA
jgi:hypothetical protein